MVLPGFEMKSLPKILPRIAYPIEPFGFVFVEHNLPPPLLESMGGSLWKQTGLFDQPEDGQANDFQIHLV